MSALHGPTPYIVNRLAEIRDYGYTHVATRERADAIAEAARAEGMNVEVVEQRGFWEVREA